MSWLKMFPSSVLFVFIVAAFVNNMALTSPQTRDRKPPNYREVPPTRFSCDGRPAGYYADPEAECQAYHMCDTLEQQYSYLCPGYTLFNQKFMVCDHWHAVNCSISDQFYDLNKKIGQVPGEESATEEDNVIESTKETRKLSSVFKFNVGNSSPLSKTTTTTLKPAISRIKQLRTTPPIKKHRSNVTAVINTTVITRPTLKNTVQRPTDTSGRTPVTTTEPLSSQIFPTTQRSFHLFALSKPKGLSLTARGTKIKFGRSRNDDSSSQEEILRIKFRPLLKESKKFFFDKRNFTVPPTVFRPTSPSPLDEEGEDDDDSNNGAAAKQRLDAIKPIVPFLIPPLVESPSLPPPTPRTFLVPPVRGPPSLFLVPPAKGPVILQGENQEIRTPLVVSNQFFSLKHLRLNIPESQIIPPRFPFSRSNRDFFIPSSGLLAPIGDNSLSDEEEEGKYPVPQKMTMTFPNRTMLIRRRLPLKINPKCPRCHPAFLRPNECQPCVIIK